MSTERAREQVRQLLDGLSDLEVREVCIAGLRAARRGNRLDNGNLFSLHGHLGREVIPLLADRKGVTLNGPPGEVNLLKEPFLDCLNESWMTGVFEFMNWFVRAGLAWPLGAPVNGSPITLRLTRAGLRFLDLAEDHPLLPGSIERVVARCPGLPNNVQSLLAQGRACLDQGLMQPAIVMMGVAYETAVDRVVDVLVGRGVLADQERGAARRIRDVRDQIDNLFPGRDNIDDRAAMHRAYGCADELRRRRNDGGHAAPTYGFEDREEAEEFLISALRLLPSLWQPAT